MKSTQKSGHGLRSIFAWFLILVGAQSGVVYAIVAFVALFGGFSINSFSERLTVFAVSIVGAAIFFAILRLGIRVKNGGKKKNIAPAEVSSAPEPESNPEEYLDDVTFILGMRHVSQADYSWQQYDVVLNAAGYGWDMMKDWADYLSEVDLENVSQVMSETYPVTQSYIDHGRKCTQTPELDTERGTLSIAGMSKVLHAPVKIVWFNQTNQLRLFTSVHDELTMRKYVETAVRRTFGSPDAMKLGMPVPEKESASDSKPAPEKEPTPNPEPAPEKEPASVSEAASNEEAVEPVRFEGSAIYFESDPFRQWQNANPQAPEYRLMGALTLTEKEPVIELYEDGVKTREYCLQTENDEDFTGKYFLIAVRLSMYGRGSLSVPTAQIDGFISDTPEDRDFKSDDVGYRMEGHFLRCGGGIARLYYEKVRGMDLPAKGLKYPGYTTPSNVRLVGICPDCLKSFCFHGYSLYLGQCDAAYSDDGLDCCSISSPIADKDAWAYQADGKTFRYYNSFCCPHCGTPYIDYRTNRDDKRFGVSGCVHLGRKLYHDTDNQ